MAIIEAFGSNSVSYDAWNKWASGTIDNSGTITNLAFSYDGLGRRVSRTVGGGRTDYWYDQTGLTQESGAANATYLRDPNGTLLSISTGGAVYNYGLDRLGSVTALVNSSQTIASSYSYDPWGQTIASSGSVNNPFHFTGTYFDSATRMYQMGHRYYQPSTGRFTQQDPLCSSIYTSNRYAYTDGNPANFTDPTGLSHETDCWSRCFWSKIIIYCTPSVLGCIFAGPLALQCATVLCSYWTGAIATDCYFSCATHQPGLF
jgi:RHS repeat-associated protein